MRKYRYLYVIQANFGYGWEDLDIIDKHEKYIISTKPKEITARAYLTYLAKNYKMAISTATIRHISRREGL